MWAMLTAKLQTLNGKKYMRDNPGDPQEVFKLLHQEYRESLKAEFTSDNQLERLKSLRISKWTGTYESFLDHFTKQLDLYVEQVAESPSPCHESDKKKYLKDAVAGASVLAGIHTQENITRNGMMHRNHLKKILITSKTAYMSFLHIMMIFVQR